MAGEKIVTISDPNNAGLTAVEVWTTKLDHNLNKPIVAIAIPRQSAEIVSDDPDSWIIDIGRVNEVITVQGFLVDDSTTSAYTKKTYLVNLVHHGKTIQIQWGTTNTQTIVGSIQKCMITETPGKTTSEGGSTDQERDFAVQLTLIKGTNKAT